MRGRWNAAEYCTNEGHIMVHVWTYKLRRGRLGTVELETRYILTSERSAEYHGQLASAQIGPSVFGSGKPGFHLCRLAGIVP